MNQLDILRGIFMTQYVVALLGNKDSKTTLKHIKSFEFDLDEITYSTGWITMATPSDGKQSGNATLAIAKSDNGYIITLTGSFINKRKFDGDHFVAIAGLLTAEGKVIEKLQVKRGLDGMWKNLRFKTQRGGATTQKTIPSLKEVSLIVLSLGYHDTISDKAFWDQVGKIATQIAKTLLSEKNKESEQVNV